MTRSLLGLSESAAVVRGRTTGLGQAIAFKLDVAALVCRARETPNLKTVRPCAGMRGDQES